MSELINKNDNRATIRWKLLTGASVLALTAYVVASPYALAEDASRPQVWIELGGEMDLMGGTSSPFVEPFMQLTPTPDPYKGESPISAQRPPRYAMGLDGKISFQPEESDWIFSAGIRYGRSHGNKHVHHQTAFPQTQKTICTYYCQTVINPHLYNQLADTTASHKEQHAVLDFQAGKDVGLGLLGPHGTSTISAGVRFAQFSERSHLNIYARPTVNIIFPTLFQVRAFSTFHDYTMHAQAARSFTGVGPLLSWNASATLAGNTQDGEITFDWGLDAAVLFGRQKAKTASTVQAYEQTFHLPQGVSYHTLYPLRPDHSTRSRSVAVPNVGGFAGLSYRYVDAKISLGYRYDTFLNAMDTGIDAAKKSNLTFNGPYASISIGLGD